jgi:type II secretory pathway pseudopilin PulG
MNTITNKKGMTLVEVIVYLALAALLLAPLIFLFQKSTQSMVRGASSTDMHMSGRDILNIMYDDLKNTGYKIRRVADSVVVDGAAGPPAVDPIIDSMVVTGIMYDPNNATVANRDSSSFRAFDAPPPSGTPADPEVDASSPGGRYDSLTIRKGVMSSAGAWFGYDSVTYFVDNTGGNKLLKRKITSLQQTTPPSPIPNTWDGAYGYTPTSSASEQTLARDVEALQFQYSPDLRTWVDIPADATAKKNVKYIKIILVLRASGQVGALQKAPPMDVANCKLAEVASPILRDRYEIVVPIPNNGMHP